LISLATTLLYACALLPADASALIQATPIEAGSPAAPSETWANWVAEEDSLENHEATMELALAGAGEVDVKTVGEKTELEGESSSVRASASVPATQLCRVVVGRG